MFDALHQTLVQFQWEYPQLSCPMSDIQKCCKQNVIVNNAYMPALTGSTPHQPSCHFTKLYSFYCLIGV